MSHGILNNNLESCILLSEIVHGYSYLNDIWEHCHPHSMTNIMMHSTLRMHAYTWTAYRWRHISIFGWGGVGFMRGVTFIYWFFIKHVYIIYYCQRSECWNRDCEVIDKFISREVATSVGSTRHPSLLNFILKLSSHTCPMWSPLLRFACQTPVSVVLNYDECLFTACACVSAFDICHRYRARNTRWTKE